MRKYGYLVVEGPHDVEFVYRLLSPFGLKRIQQQADLDTFFTPLIPRQFPINGDLLKRVPVPVFVQSDTHCIAVHVAGGDSRLAPTVQENAAVLDFATVTGVGVLIDSDSQADATSRFKALVADMQGLGFAFPKAPGEIGHGPPNFGVFVLPDNHACGTLENLLIESAELAYPELLESAKLHVQTCSEVLSKDEAKDLQKPSGNAKAIVGSIASILRPGKAVQVSIQDNNWLRGACLNLPKVKAAQQFLQKLFGL